jgi:uncharacterized membrane protein
MEIKEIVDTIGLIIDVVGVAVITFGVIFSSVFFIFNASQQKSFAKYRHNLGKAILLGLEFLIAGDLIRTVGYTPELSTVSAIALIVLIRTILSMALHMEVTGVWPWQKEK